MNEYYWPRPMAKKTSVSQPERFLPDAKTTTGEKSAILVNKLPALFLFTFLPSPHPGPAAP